MYKRQGQDVELLVDDDEIVRLGPEGFRAIDLEGAPVRLHQLSIDWDLETAQKGGRCV